MRTQTRTQSLSSLVRGWWVGALQTTAPHNNNLTCHSGSHTRSFSGLRFAPNLWEEQRRNSRKRNPPPPTVILKTYTPPGSQANVRKRFPAPPKYPSPLDPTRYCPTASLEIHQGTASKLKSDEDLEAGAFIEEDGKTIKVWQSKHAGGLTKRVYHFLRFNGPAIRDLIYSEFQDDISKTGLTRVLNFMRRNQKTIYARKSTPEEIKLKKFGQVMRVYTIKMTSEDPDVTAYHKVRIPAEQIEFEAGKEARRTQNLANRDANAAKRAPIMKSWFEDRL